MMQQELAYWRVNKQKSFPADQYTHFQFKIRSAPGRGIISIGVAFQNMSGSDFDRSKYGVNTINDPRYCATCPADDTQWHTVRIPLGDLGLGSGVGLYDQLWQFTVWPTNWEGINTTLYFDEISFINGQASFTPIARDLTNVDLAFDYATLPTTLNPGLNLPIPGVVTLQGSSGNSGSSNSQAGASSPPSASSWAVPVVVILVLLVVIVIGIAAFMFYKYKQASELV